MLQNIILQLNSWYTGGSNMPLVVRGMRGVGKTCSVLKFARSIDGPYLYVNFETDAVARRLFEDSTKDVNIAAAEYFNVSLDALDRFLLIFDEYQACNRDLLSLDALKSVSGLKLICMSSFDVKPRYDALNEIYLRPASFREFLETTGKSWYREVLEGHYAKNKQVPAIVHQEILDLFYDYVLVGGMPGAIKVYQESEDDNLILEEQLCELSLIKQDIINYGGSLSNGMLQVLNSIPTHIIESKMHFMPGLIRRGLTVRNISSELEALVSIGAICRIDNMDNTDEFRVNLSDGGLLRALLISETEVRGDMLDYSVMASLITNEISLVHNAKYVRRTGNIYVDYCFENEMEEKVGLDCSFNRLRRRNSFESLMLQAGLSRMYRLGEENYSMKDVIADVPVYAYELL